MEVSMNQNERLDYLIEAFKEDSVEYKNLKVPVDIDGKKRILRSLMNIRMPREMNTEVLKIQDEYLREAINENGIVYLSDIDKVEDNISIWQGDITRLKVDAIVNAANSQMLGCFIPMHSCIDNCIHTFAGVELRNECNKKMNRLRIRYGRDYEQPTAIPMLTDAYNLPAKKIVHIPKVLYHWRCHMNSTASNPQSKLYAFEAGARAIKAHIERMGNSLPVEKIEKGVDYGIYHKYFIMKEQPLLSIIIPNKDHSDDLDLAIRSIVTKSTYKNIEFIVVENNSTEKKTFDYYEKIQKEFDNVKVVFWEREFNYSLINNFGVGYASGEYLFFLNNDIEMINPTSIEEMMWYAFRKDVGIVGARLLYNDDTIQHAGVVVGFGGVAGHTFIGLSDVENSYFHRALTLQDYSAVTAAALITKKSIFNEVGGFSEELAVAFNDIDFCMKVRSKDYLVVYNPYALFYHYESKSRGLEDSPEKIERFNRETAIFMKRWPKILAEGDPYYNPNLTLRKSNFALRDLLHEKIGEPFIDEKIKKYL